MWSILLAFALLPYALGYIVNGFSARPRQFPYQVGLYIDQGYGPLWCGGALIDHEWVLTAAHCTLGLKRAIVYMGSHRIADSPVIHVVRPDGPNVISHAGYNEAERIHDIALLRIPWTPFDDLVQAVQLPPQGSPRDAYAGRMAIASGWGRTVDSDSKLADSLQWVRVRIESKLFCQRSFQIVITHYHMCSSVANGSSTCRGDSGGPLVLADSNLLVGITAFGSPSCSKASAAGYTRVSRHVPWIRKHIQRHSLAGRNNTNTM